MVYSFLNEFYLLLENQIFITWMLAIPVCFFSLSFILRKVDKQYSNLSVLGERKSDVMSLELVAMACLVNVTISSGLMIFGFAQNADELSTRGAFAQSEYIKQYVIVPFLSYQAEASLFFEF